MNGSLVFANYQCFVIQNATEFGMKIPEIGQLLFNTYSIRHELPYNIKLYVISARNCFIASFWQALDHFLERVS